MATVFIFFFPREKYGATKVIHKTQASLSEPKLERDPALHHIDARRLHYMEPTALHSSEGEDFQDMVCEVIKGRLGMCGECRDSTASCILGRLPCRCRGDFVVSVKCGGSQQCGLCSVSERREENGHEKIQQPQLSSCLYISMVTKGGSRQ